MQPSKKKGTEAQVAPEGLIKPPSLVLLNTAVMDFRGSPGVQIPCGPQRRCGFDPLLEKFCMSQGVAKIKKEVCFGLCAGLYFFPKAFFLTF